jgi:hypothetical protein
MVLDAGWRVRFETDELVSSYQDQGASKYPKDPPIGSHFFSAEARRFYGGTLGGAWATIEVHRARFLDAGRYALADTPGGRDELRRLVRKKRVAVTFPPFS